MRSLETIHEVFQLCPQTSYDISLYSCPISAGFPSPADDYLEGKLDLNKYLIEHPAATFFVRVTGDSMIGSGIHADDMLIVDRSLEAKDGRVVIAVVNGELLVKRLKIDGSQVFLVADNPHYPLLRITEAMDFHVWGVVTNVIHPL